MNTPIKARTAFAIVLVLSTLAACKRDAPAPTANPNGDYRVQTWPLPAEIGSMAPDLNVAPDGRLLLSWINRQQGRRNALQFSTYTEEGGWQSQPRTVAVGRSLIASWADTPHMLATPDGALWMQWLQGNPASPSGYDTVLARSRDGGMRWEQLTHVNDDGLDAEHGFAALWAAGTDRLGIAWLDGRTQVAAQGRDGKDEAQHGGGATQLRANAFDMSLNHGMDAVLDARACDCCQTDVAQTTKGPLLVYRDRSDDDIRDIAALRFENGRWSASKPVHADGWKIEGCPVNGPAVTAQGNDAVVAWYSEAGGEAAVRLARSADAGDTFAAPLIVDKGATVLGRVDVARDAQQVWVSWLREDANGQALMLARYTPDLSRELQRMTVAKLDARGHASGSPKLVANAMGAWLAWTDSLDGVAHLKGALIAR
ncbi:sialidase family protein [Thermomonas sp. HDW16]|uniref:sialidase family protein n=1 Tax=Thermomonas sp. HDW16 TaxID=2714945 RepID=UPI00140DB95B|nr:sialidase family protein [Thermomonas sp. HDW16]QIL19502.1 exo-alpha-sialidase [Thermomonas sp. HDW16]